MNWEALPPIFSTLRRLDIRGSMFSIVLFLSSLAATRLQMLVFQPDGQPYGIVAIYDYLMPVPAERLGGSLKSLDLHINEPRPRAGESDLVIVILQGIKPLVDAGLQSLRLFFQVDSTMAVRFPPEVQSMLEPSAWPSLEQFYFATKENILK